jgi:hypothetical protein
VIEERRKQSERERTSCGILAIYLSACIDQQTAIFIHYIPGLKLHTTYDGKQPTMSYTYIRVQKLWKLFCDR